MMRLFCRFDSISMVFADGGYTGMLIEWAEEMFGYRVEVVKRNEQHKFRVLHKLWIVERSFAWLNLSRRLSKDYELRHTSTESMTYIAFTHQLLRRSD
jgi:transposase